jgi:NifU-like protein
LPADLTAESSYPERVQEKAEAVIAEVIRPLVEADGGRVVLVEVTGNRVVIELSGTCKGCPGQPYTLARVIEPALRRALGAPVEVEARFVT